MTSREIRQKYLDFFATKQHTVLPSASLLPENDSSLLFTNSGMSPLVPYLSGERHPGGVRLVNCQKCFRTEDIEEVGDNRHNTFFEMLGNWSLGDYFKTEQLAWYYEFLTKELGIDINRLYQTVYMEDKEGVTIAKELFKSYGLDAELGTVGATNDFTKHKIFVYGKDKNWWQRGEAVGELGGPDSETFYDTGKPHDPKFGSYCHPNCDCGRFIEIGNSVFMQYQKTADGWAELKHKNVDFGGGLERTTMVLQNKDNVFETDLFINLIQKLEELSHRKYRDHMRAFEVIADHLKATTFLMGDQKGIAPSNTDQGYIVRRLIRRALRYARQLEITTTDWPSEIAKIVITDYQQVYPELLKNQDFIIKHLTEEVLKFSVTLERGLKESNAIIKLSASNKVQKISGSDTFNLYQTYGFPIEMTKELATEQGLEVDEAGFRVELAKHQELSRTASVGKFKGGLADHSEVTTKFHTANHLLLAALRQVLGDHVYQKGSNITGDRLRFDFSHAEKLTPEQLQQVEALVNQAISAKLPVSCQEMSLAQAKELGAMGVFESKYDEQVKVYTIGDSSQPVSREICGGPHVQNTGELGKFQIIKEESSSSGVRRIKAVWQK